MEAWMVIVPFALLLTLLSAGQWIGLAFCTVALIVGYFYIGPQFMGVLASRGFAALDHGLLTAIPLFVLMGTMVTHSGMSTRLYHAISPFVQVLPGKLLHTNILAGTVFAAACGSSHASVATIGTMAISDQMKMGYSKRMVDGSIAASGTLAILIPPSILMIIYGSWMGESIPRLFIAGMLPGLMISSLFSIYILTVGLVRPGIAPTLPTRMPFRKNVLGLAQISPLLILVVVVLGSIYSGIATPSEAAAVGAAASIILAAAYRKLSWQVFKNALQTTVIISGFSLLLYFGAQLLGIAFGYGGILGEVQQALSSLPLGPFGIFWVIVAMYMVLGCFLDGLSLLVLTIPFTYPVITGLGFDGIWFGVVVTLLIEVALITPPVGPNLFIVQGLTGHDFRDVALGALPFVIMLLVGITLISFFPQIALWLPSKML